jgi:DNA-directed RNA polymerase subunit beta
MLRALGCEDPAFLERFVRPFDFTQGQWQKDKGIAPSREEALVETYKRPRSGEPPDVESARVYFENAFFNPKRCGLTRVGRYKLDRRLHPEVEKLEEILGLELDTPEPGQGVLSQAEMLAAASYMLHLANGVAITASTTTSTSRIAAYVRSLS